jgi:hypothetical protein
MTKSMTAKQTAIMRPAAIRRAIPARTPAIEMLLQMHTYARPAGGAGEAAFCAKYLDRIPGMAIDTYGNRILTVGTAPRVMWSSHTDTVHKAEGRPRLAYGDGWLTVKNGDPASCLGADCSAGVWLMVQMIARRIPGLYVFHAAEEVGGLGSAHIAAETPSILSKIDHAIAFDRRGYTSVVTHQYGGRCASDAFAKTLASQLGGDYAPDDGGTFTDTASYTSLIPECTNISVGYFEAHTASESLDVAFLADLLERICKLDPTSWPIARAPGEDDYGGSYGRFSTSSFGYDDFTRTRYSDDKPGQTLEDLAADYPTIAAEILEDLGVTPAEFMEVLDLRTSRRRRP